MKRMPIAALLFASLLILPGCHATPTAPSTQPSPPSPLAVSAGDVLILAARAGLAQASAQIESGYAQGKMTYTEYQLARNEEQAALNALAGLQTANDNGTPVTQADINAAIGTFIAPLNGLVNKYALTTLPPAQPAK